MTTFGNRAFDFLNSLQPNFSIPDKIDCLLPFESDEVKIVNQVFYEKYFNDNNSRIAILGINPGRFGAGITGVNFTDPIKLESNLGIKNTFIKRNELSSDFVYHVINNFGGPEIFYSKFYISSVCPIGFTSNGKNLNYYDDKTLKKNISEFIIHCLAKQIEIGLKTTKVICLGEGLNFNFLSELNKEYKFFEEIIPLPHPRFIMQYRRKQINDYLEIYLNTLSNQE